MKILVVFWNLVKDSIDATTHGTRLYHLWMAILTITMLIGMYCYSIQIEHGLSVTGMNDRVSWGLYISNFTFLVGVAAAAVMLVMPTYILKDIDFKRAVLIGEGLAVAALIMCLAFVIVDMGGPGVLWHMLPVVGVFNFPNSMLTWDVIVLNGYLFINITVPMYILFRHYQGKEAKPNVYIPGALLSVFWAVGIHLVTAFLYQGLQARPFWNNALLGPRFLASAFAAGPALIILVLAIIRKTTAFNIEDKTIKKLSMVVTVAAQINLIMLVSELFKEFYAPTHHSESAYYLFFGLDGKEALLPWIHTSIFMNVVSTIMLTFHKLRNNFYVLYTACILLFIAIWIEKGFGLIVPGFIPGPYGKIMEYQPTGIEIGVTLGIWAMGAFIFTILAKTAILIETGKLRFIKKEEKAINEVEA
ncbi:sulfate reduction electron transfer complex DsrMKJOP subunit DsrP [Aureibacter tunicatorum]|uniref:Molybdopterin-containing oxidoreductase family membrane subunit n=1 Tax=Aureibacter tunicatorum TaxID=866807 RepID=A0AAE4BQA4_9BACT|nr:NrfD/PsrC family molybdoenzyme membrane anchor subunit [Aureibacter tunicatorum]MDR6237356.1 molybdopterin-containing oxidoreductase family membrane subunit [Aureibacter tunicatorum]BDD06347.1 Hdr menaquinol oxidoreductase integral membrane subunit [Aureibacter tunicatorum]